MANKPKAAPDKPERPEIDYFDDKWDHPDPSHDPFPTRILSAEGLRRAEEATKRRKALLEEHTRRAAGRRTEIS
jgi:hypothetical protein